MPRKTKNRRKRDSNPAKRGNKKEFERFLARAKSLGINPTYKEFERAIQRLAKQQRKAKEIRKPPR
jgi:DnaJ-domain-containing protein 1